MRRWWRRSGRHGESCHQDTGSKRPPRRSASETEAWRNVAGGLPCYLHLPRRHLWFLRQQLHPSLPQHAFGRRPVLLQHCLHPPIILQKLPPRLRQRRPVTASASREAKTPRAVATTAAPVSFSALPRVMVPLSRAMARLSREVSTSWSLFINPNVGPPLSRLAPGGLTLSTTSMMPPLHE